MHADRYKIFVFVITIVKVLLMGIFSSEYQNDLFLPFVSSFLEEGTAAWQLFYEAGKTDAFPYPIVMLCIQGMGLFLVQLFSVRSLFWVNVCFKMPSLILDFVCLRFLVKLFPSKRKYAAVFYFGSPVILYAVYMHGQLDLIPTCFLVAAVFYLSSGHDYSYLFGGLCLSAALLSKQHILAAVPILFLYLLKRDGCKRAILFFSGVLAVAFLGMFPFFSEAFYKMVLFNAEQSILTQVALKFGSVKLYVPIAAVLLVYLAAYGMHRMNRDLLLSLIGIVFAVFLALCPPMPGWYVWIVPFITVFFVNVDKEKYKNIWIYMVLNLFYLIYFIVLHDRGRVDLFAGRRDLSFLKIQHPMFRNLVYTLLFGMLIYIIISMYQLGVASNLLYRRKNLPFMIGVAGDSGTGKSTFLALVERCLGARNLLYIEGDGDHRWERGEKPWEAYTHLNPKANFLYRQAQDLAALRSGVAVKRTEYDHETGKFTAARKIKPQRFVLLCGLHALYLPQTRKNLDLKIYMDVDETLRKYWKIQRDVKYRGYSKEKILDQIQSRLPDARKYIYPQKEYADMIVQYYDEGLKDCMADHYDVQISAKITISAAIDVEPVIDELTRLGIYTSWEYSQDLKRQTIDIRAEHLEEQILPLDQIAQRIIPQLEEITRENFKDCNGKDSVLMLFLLLLICEKMRGGYNIKAVIFDLDDTLYDYSGLHKQALVFVAQRFSEKLGVSSEDFLRIYEDAREYVKREMRDCASRHNRILYFQKLAELLEHRPAKDTLDMYECYWGYLLRHMKLADGVRECFWHLKKEHVKIAICTDLTAHIQHRKLKQLQIEDDIDVFVSSEEAEEEKPAPKMFDLVLRKLHLSSGEVVYVGDSFKKDIAGAAKAGIFPIWITKETYMEKADFAMKMVHSFGQIEEFLFDGKDV